MIENAKVLRIWKKKGVKLTVCLHLNLWWGGLFPPGRVFHLNICLKFTSIYQDQKQEEIEQYI